MDNTSQNGYSKINKQKMQNQSKTTVSGSRVTCSMVAWNRKFFSLKKIIHAHNTRKKV